MAKILGYEEIGYVAATFKVDDNTVASLKANHLDASTGRVDVNGKKLVVALKGDHTVGFGTGTANDAVFGVMVAYEQDGYATVMTSGYLEEVPTAKAVALGASNLAVDANGKVTVVDGAASKAQAIKAATSSDLYITIKL